MNKDIIGNIYWSTDEETYNLDTLDDVLEYLLWDNEPAELVGGEVYYGTAKPYSTEWVDAAFVIDNISERAYDEAGEWALDFPNVSEKAKGELQTFLSEWQEKHCDAGFYRVVNAQKYIITQEDVDKYLEENQ